jgi:hypothetical protein
MHLLARYFSFPLFFPVVAEGASSASATAASVGDEMNVDGDDVAGDRQCLPLSFPLRSTLTNLIQLCVCSICFNRDTDYFCFLCDYWNGI